MRFLQRGIEIRQSPELPVFEVRLAGPVLTVSLAQGNVFRDSAAGTSIFGTIRRDLGQEPRILA